MYKKEAAAVITVLSGTWLDMAFKNGWVLGLTVGGAMFVYWLMTMITTSGEED